MAEEHGFDRRRFLTVGAFAVAAGAGVFAYRGGRRPSLGRPLRAVAPAAPQEQSIALFGELRAGAQLDRWSIVDVERVAAGGIVVTMATQTGERFQVDVLKRDDAALGVAQTRSLSLYLVNGGDGRLASVEEHGLGAMALGAWLDARETSGAEVPQLLTLRERAARRRRPQKTERTAIG
jgi:hypothetical protein